MCTTYVNRRRMKEKESVIDSGTGRKVRSKVRVGMILCGGGIIL